MSEHDLIIEHGGYRYMATPVRELDPDADSIEDQQEDCTYLVCDGFDIYVECYDGVAEPSNTQRVWSWVAFLDEADVFPCVYDGSIIEALKDNGSVPFVNQT